MDLKREGNLPPVKLEDQDGSSFQGVMDSNEDEAVPDIKLEDQDVMDSTEDEAAPAVKLEVEDQYDSTVRESHPIIKQEFEDVNESLIDHHGEGQATAVKLEYYEESRPIVKEDLEDDMEDPSASHDIHPSDQDYTEDVPGDRDDCCLENSTYSFGGEYTSIAQVSSLTADVEDAGREVVDSDVNELGQPGTVYAEISAQSDVVPRPHRCDLCGLTFPSVNGFQAHLSTHSKSLGVSSQDSETDDSGSDDMDDYETDASLSERDLDENNSVGESSNSKRKRKRSPSADEANKLEKASGSGIGGEESSDESEGGSEAHRCDICGSKYKYRKGLKIHLLTHGTKDHKCDICKKAYAKRDVLVRHRREVHFKDNSKTSKDNNFICDLCGKGFAAFDRMQKHKQHHSEKRPYKCDVCARAFVLNGDLKKHYMTHTQERPHECKECKKKFARNSTLKKHLRTHTGEKPYACDVCGDTFARNDVLILHERVHSGEFSLKCDTCNGMFKQKASLIAHLKAGDCRRKRITRFERTPRRKRDA